MNSLYLKYKETNARYYRKNREKILIQHKEYKNKIRYSGLREIILKRDDYSCRHCGIKDNLTIDHIDGNGYFAKIKNNDPSNLMTLCRSCHGKKDVVRRGNFNSKQTEIHKKRISESMKKSWITRRRNSL